jgi:hypothetical protein
MSTCAHLFLGLGQSGPSLLAFVGLFTAGVLRARVILSTFLLLIHSVISPLNTDLENSYYLLDTILSISDKTVN